MSRCLEALSRPLLAYDSRKVAPSSVFFAFAPMPGGRPGSDFIADAIARGAAEVVCQDSPQAREQEALHPGVRFVFAANPQAEFSRRTALRHPEAGSLRLVGVTGTDGKTTTCNFLHQILNLAGTRAGLLSTVSLDDGTRKRPSPYRQSTPEADALYAFLSSCAGNGLGTVVLEATSHALDPRTSRLSRLVFDGAVYTSLTSEHLEFHGSLEAYIQSKLNLARQTRGGGFVLAPEGGPRNAQIRQSFPGARFGTYGVSGLRVVSRTLTETVLQAGGQEGDGKPIVRFPYGEECYLANAAGALEAARLLTGRAIDASILGRLSPVEGRMEAFPTRRGLFIIDFAHTEDSFDRLMRFVRSQRPRARMCAVFSSGGRRDTAKRARMGAVAARFCQTIILTSEDPRDEGFERITADILQGVGASGARIILEPDRREAIREAARLSTEDAVTLLLGKGHERTIEFENGRKEPWSEKAALLSALEEAGL